MLDPKTKALGTGNLAPPADHRRTAAARCFPSAQPRRPLTVSPLADREDVARLISKYDLLAVPVVDKNGHVLGIVTVDDIIDAMIEESTEDVQKFGGVEALEAPYMEIGFLEMIQKRAGWLCALFLGEMLTASAMQHFESELEKAVVLTLFIPLIMSSGGNSGSQATSLIIRAVALQEVRLSDWWRVALRELPTGVMLGSILGVIGIIRIALWQKLGVFDYGEHWVLVACTVGAALVGIVTFGSPRRIDAAVRPEANGLRSRERVGALRGDAGRCHRTGDLFQHCADFPARDAALSRSARATFPYGAVAKRALARCLTLALFSCPQAAMMSRPRGERTGLA